MFAESSTDPIQCNGIGARIQIAQAKADNSEIVPEFIVWFLGIRIEVEEQHKHVIWQEANGKNQNKN